MQNKAITDGDLTIARTSGLQTALECRSTVSRALTSNGSGKVAVS